jgi:DNA-binding CsgD family transcriptional regulator
MGHPKNVGFPSVQARPTIAIGMTDTASEARKKIRRLCHRGLDWVALSEQAGKLIRRVVPHERVCWHPTDPATLLVTGSYVENLFGDGLPPLTWCEYAVEDVNKWSFLARSPWPVGILSRATHGHREQSPRYRELLRPQGIGWELRASFVTDSACWGTLGIYRDRGEADFSDAEAAFLAAISSTLGEGFRRALLLSSVVTEENPDGPGLLLLDDEDGVTSITPAAERWLDELVDLGDLMEGRLPLAVTAVADRARAIDGGVDSPAPQARARAYTGSGRWLVLHGTRLSGGSEGQTAVIIEPARRAELAPLIVQAYGLSGREREVTRLVLQGLSTREIADRLFISMHTVQDHLKAIFDKVDVHSRRELVARVSSDHFSPHTR